MILPLWIIVDLFVHRRMTLLLGRERSGADKSQRNGERNTFLSESENYYEVHEILYDQEDAPCGFEPISVGHNIIWKKNEVTEGVWSTFAEIKERIPGFISFLKAQKSNLMPIRHDNLVLCHWKLDNLFRSKFKK